MVYEPRRERSSDYQSGSSSLSARQPSTDYADYSGQRTASYHDTSLPPIDLTPPPLLDSVESVDSDTLAQLADKMGLNYIYLGSDLSDVAVVDGFESTERIPELMNNLSALSGLVNEEMGKMLVSIQRGQTYGWVEGEINNLHSFISQLEDLSEGNSETKESDFFFDLDFQETHQPASYWIEPGLTLASSSQSQTKQSETDSQEPSEAIVVTSPTDIAVPGTTINYEVAESVKGENLSYQWKIINDLTQIAEEEKTGFFGSRKYPERQNLGTEYQGELEAQWDFPGRHTIELRIHKAGKLQSVHYYRQEVQNTELQAQNAFKENTPPPMQSDVYITWLNMQKELAISQGVEDKQLQQLDEAIENATELLGVSQENPTGSAIPISATLIPTAEPIAAPLQLYLKQLGQGNWAIVDLTNPDPGEARTYEGRVKTTGRGAERIAPDKIPAMAITRAWVNFVRNNPHPAGEMVAQFPEHLMGSMKTTKQGHSDGESTLGKVRNWFGGIGLVTGLGGLALTVATGGVGTVAVGLFIAASASSAIAGGSNIADRVEHGNFEWDGETALDLVDIAGGLAGGTTAILSIGSKAANVTKLRNAMLIGESIETGTDVTGGLILGAQYLGAVEEIKQNPDLSPQQKQEEIQKILVAAAAVGGLMVLGTAGWRGSRNADVDVEVDAPNRANDTVNNSAETVAAAPTTTSEVEVDSSTAPQQQTEPTTTPTLSNSTPDTSSLINALPEDLRSVVSITADNSLQGSTVRVYYQPEIQIRVGTNATPADIQLHVPTVRTLQRYSGLTGKVRALIERITNWIRRNGEPPFGSVAWEAKLELEKLPAIIQAKQAQLASGEIDAATRTQLETDIADLESQIAYHTRNLDEMDTDPGRGFIAAEIRLDSDRLLSRLEAHTTNIERQLRQLPPSDEVNSLLQQLREIQTTNTELSLAQQNGTYSHRALQLGKKLLVEKFDALNAEVIRVSSTGLSTNTTGLGADGFSQYKQWQQELVDTEELISLDPQFQEQYAPQLRQQQLDWLQTSEDTRSNSDGWYTLIKELSRPDLADIRKQVAPILIQRKNARIEEITAQLKTLNSNITKVNYNLKQVSGGGYNAIRDKRVRELKEELKDLTAQRKLLNDEQVTLKEEITRVEQLKTKITPNPDTQRFADDVTPDDVWLRLKQNHDSGSESSSNKFAGVLIGEGIVSSEGEIIAYLGSINPGGQTLGKVRQQLKEHFRPQLLSLIDAQPTAELKYQKMRSIAENLDVREQGEFSEYWYQIEVASDRGVPNSTQVTLDKTQAVEEYGIELNTQKNRRFDEVYGDENSAIIREHKHIKGKLQGDQLEQYQDNLKIVQHNQRIGDKEAQGVGLSNSKEDNPVILEKDDKKFRPNKLVYTFATPEGVKANVKFMDTQLRNPDNRRILSFEIINSRGEIKTIKNKNIKDLEEPALSHWLDSKN